MKVWLLFLLSITPFSLPAYANGQKLCLRQILESIEAKKTVEIEAHSTRLARPTKRDNNLVFGEPDLAEVDRFNEHIKLVEARGGAPYDGTVPLPKDVGLFLRARMEGDGGTYQIEYDTGSIQSQSRDMRNLMKDLKTRSMDTGTELGEEFGAMIFDFDDGTTQVVKFTSREKFFITSEDQKKAISAAGIMGGTRKINRVTHVHTHPHVVLADKGNITPSLNDFRNLKYWETVFSKKLDAKSTFQGVLLPNCDTCADLFIAYQYDGLSKAP